MLTLKPAEDVMVSYLPLSHVAAQLVDMWIGVYFAMTTYFAEPDALKVMMPTVGTHMIIISDDSLSLL